MIFAEVIDAISDKDQPRRCIVWSLRKSERNKDESPQQNTGHYTNGQTTDCFALTRRIPIQVRPLANCL
jgi:hypothetical protein